MRDGRAGKKSKWAGEIKKDALKLVKVRLHKSGLSKKKHWILEYLQKNKIQNSNKYSQDNNYKSKKTQWVSESRNPHSSPYGPYHQASRVPQYEEDLSFSFAIYKRKFCPLPLSLVYRTQNFLSLNSLNCTVKCWDEIILKLSSSFMILGESLLLSLTLDEACLCSNQEVEKKKEGNKPLEDQIKFTNIWSSPHNTIKKHLSK